MAVKRPLCNYSGETKELAVTDFLVGMEYFPTPIWKINAGETVIVRERGEYLIGNGTLICAGELDLSAEAILIVRA